MLDRERTMDKVIEDAVEYMGGDRVAGMLYVLTYIYGTDAEVFDIALHTLRKEIIDGSKM